MARSTATHEAFVLAAFVATACGSTPRSSDAVDAGTHDDGAPAADSGAGWRASSVDASSGTGPLESELESFGYTTAREMFAPIDLATCCVTGGSCYDSNPSSPYFAFFLPPARGQTAKNPEVLSGADTGGSGMSSAWRLREGEAIVYVGPTPPPASYFGFTPYLFDRDAGGGQRTTLFASLSATANNLSFHAAGGGSVYGAETVVIAAADKKTSADVARALTRAGYDPSSFNVVVFDASVAQFGIDDGADTFAVLFRVAEFGSTTAKEGASWVAQPHGTLLRVTPEHESSPDPLAPIVRKETSPRTENTEALEASVAALKAAILARYPSMKSSSLTVTDVPTEPATCVLENKSCGGSNPDTNYPLSATDQWPTNDQTFYMVYGVDHAATGKTQYSSFDVMALDHKVGVAGITSAHYAGSAAAFVPEDPNVVSLYACRVASSCAASPPDECCLAVTDAACPGGLSPGADFTFSFRTYLDPTIDTAPDPTTLMPEGVLKLTPQ
jgi:hypothetical protein